MGSEIQVEEGGVEVEEARSDRVLVLAVLDHEHSELIQTLQLHVDL